MLIRLGHHHPTQNFIRNILTGGRFNDLNFVPFSHQLGQIKVGNSPTGPGIVKAPVTVSFNESHSLKLLTI